jgi:hypothetical protein
MAFPFEKKDEILRQINDIVRPYWLSAEYSEAHSVGVQGDARTYTPVIVLVGPYPGHLILRKLSNKITNNTPVNRVTFELAAKGKWTPFDFVC